jgi:hypothetical protein
MMRSACGSNDHPDSVTFLQVFRLIGTYSLVKPPRGSNVSGGEILETLLKLSVLPESTHDKQQEFNEKLNNILERGSDIHIFDDHNYIIQNSSEYVIAYLAGYFAFKAKKMTNCSICIAYLLIHIR